MMLAEMTTAPAGLITWLGCLAFVVVLVNGGFKLAANIKGPESAPPAGELDVRVAHIEERIDGFDRSISELRHEMRVDLQTVLQAGEERAGKIHGRINDVLAAVSELRGRLTK